MGFLPLTHSSGDKMKLHLLLTALNKITFTVEISTVKCPGMHRLFVCAFKKCCLATVSLITCHYDDVVIWISCEGYVEDLVASVFYLPVIIQQD